MLVATKRIILLSCVLWITTSCAVTVQTQTVPSIPQTPSQVTLTPIFIPTELPIPPATLMSSTNRHIPSQTPIPTASSTLMPEEMHMLVTELLENNNGCRLPCWWGLRPGETDWQVTRAFLSQFDGDMYITGRPGQLRAAYIQIPMVEKMLSFGEIQIAVTIQDEIIENMTISDFKSPTYQLPEFLEVYGPPDEIWLSTFFDVGDMFPFVVDLFYSNGIIVSYSTYGELKGDSIQGCLDLGPSLRLWEAKEELTFREAAKMFRIDLEGTPTLPLEEATGLDVETFYNLYKAPNTATCIETPTELWP